MEVTEEGDGVVLARGRMVERVVGHRLHQASQAVGGGMEIDRSSHRSEDGTRGPDSSVAAAIRPPGRAGPTAAAGPRR